MPKDAEPFDPSDFPNEAFEPETYDPEKHRNPVSFEVDDWEKLQNQALHKYLYPEDETEEDRENRTDILVYAGRISPEEWLEEHPSESPEDAPETLRNAPSLHRWRMRRPIRRMKITTDPDAPEEEWHTLIDNTSEEKRGEIYGPKFHTRPGGPTYSWLIWAAMFVERIQCGRFRRHDRVRSGLVALLRGAALRGPDFQIEIEDGTKRDATEPIFRQFLRAANEIEGGASEAKLNPDFDPESLPLHGEGDEAAAPAPQPEIKDFDPDPFTGPNETAGLLADTFSNAVTGALLDADGEPAPTKQGKWGRGPSGGPVRVEKLKNPYEGRAILKVQAHADADPAEVEAAMGWEMLERMDMDTVWLHALLLGHASAPHRRGDRGVMEIPRKRVENALGIRRNRNMTVRERAERVKKHVEALQSLNVQFQGVRRHRDKLHFEGDMTASPLWFVQMKARGQKDLFTGEVTADWYLQAKEGVWGSEFLHNHGDQWTPLPKEWFDQIDRRGKDWTQRLAVALLFLFRINSKNGGVVKLSAEKMLDICGTDMEGSSRRRTERKRRLSKALDALRERYNIGVHAERVHIDNTSGISHADWKRRTATFHPPDEMSGELFRNEDDGRPPLPDVKGGDWTAAQIKRLRSDLGDTQSEFAEKLGVSRQMVSRYENRHDPPSDEVRKTLDRLDSRLR